MPSAPTLDRPADVTAPRSAYRCACGHELRVFGNGRHRLYFETTDAALTEPVMTARCSSCETPLPGKGAV